MALRAMHQMRVDFGFLTETKLSHDKYTHEYQGYKVYATTSSPNQGGVALFFRNSNQWTVEGVRSFGPNIIRCSLVSGSHRWTIFGIYIPPSDSDGETLHTCSDIVYRINLTDDPVPCPIHNCPAYLTTKYLTCVHFCTRHPEVGIEFSATDTLHRCSRCGLYLSSISATHHASDFCKRYARRRLALENERKQREALNDRFYVGDKELEIVRSYRYLGRIISDDDSDDLAVASQLQKARAVWSRLGALLQSDGAGPEVMGKFWKTITQAVLLFGSETWTISQRSLRRLDRFQARCARYMARQHIRQLPDGSWEHPATAGVLDKCKMFTIDHYIKVRRRCTLFKHYADEHSSLYGDCLGLEIDGRDHNLFWWNLEHS